MSSQHSGKRSLAPILSLLAVLLTVVLAFIYFTNRETESITPTSGSVDAHRSGSRSLDVQFSDSGNVVPNIGPVEQVVQPPVTELASLLKTRYPEVSRLDATCDAELCLLTGSIVLSPANGYRSSMPEGGFGLALAENGYKPRGDIQMIAGGGEAIEFRQEFSK